MAKHPRVLVISDTHAPCMIPKYPDFLVSIYDKYKCSRVVHIGDLVDLHCVSYHEKDPDHARPESELEQARDQITELVNRFPRVEMLMGNHDSLVQRQATTAGISASMLKPFKELFELPRGWNVHPRYHKLVLDDVIYQHGETGKGGQFAALKNAQADFMSTVQGHLHAQSGCWYHANSSNLVFGMAVGWGGDHKHMAMSYGTKFSAKPIVSCGVVLGPQEAFVERMKL